jgi:hypothetical protein
LKNISTNGYLACVKNYENQKPRHMERIKGIINNYPPLLFACFMLGLAPFVPEPHILGKLRWVAGGAVGMQAADWFDLFFHGFPFILLARLVILKAQKKL